MRFLLRSVLMAMCLPLAAYAATVTIPVAEDASVNRANEDGNLNSIGLLSGLDNTGSDYEFFLKFNLPADESITSARLIGTLVDDFNEGVESFHQFYFVPTDTWSETTITFNNKPAVGDAIGGAGFDASSIDPGETINLDVTADVQREMAGDGVLSLRLGTIDGRFEDLEFFASRELDASRAFRLEISTAATAIPLPVGAYLGALLLAGVLGKALRHTTL